MKFEPKAFFLGVFLGIVIIVAASFLTNAVYAGSSAWEDPLCVSLYDGVSPASCEYEQETLDLFVERFVQRLEQKLENEDNHKAVQDVELLRAKARELGSCVINHISVNYTEQSYKDLIEPFILKDFGLGGRSLEVLTEYTNRCAKQLGIL